MTCHRATGRGAGAGLRGPGGARLLATPPPPPPPSLRSSRLAEMGAQLGSYVAQWDLARAVGKRFRGCRADTSQLKALHVDRPEQQRQDARDQGPAAARRHGAVGRRGAAGGCEKG